MLELEELTVIEEVFELLNDEILEDKLELLEAEVFATELITELDAPEPLQGPASVHALVQAVPTPGS